MKSPLLFALVCAVGALPSLGLAKIERVVEKTFTVQPGGLLKLETQGGNIEVAAGSGNEVKIVATERFNTNSESEADEIAAKLTLKFEQESTGISTLAKYEGSHFGIMHWGSWPPVQVSFKVTVPAQYRVDLGTSGGNVIVGDLDGEVLARTSGGDIRLGKISKAVDGHTSGGEVVLKEGTASVRLSTSGGNIKIGHLVAGARLETSGGNITIESCSGPLDAETSGGDVSATFPETIKEDCKLSTSGGNVSANVAVGAAFHLDASTSGGRVDADGLTVTLEKGGSGKSRLEGTVNGGGPLLRLRTSGGDVRVRTH